VSLHLWPNTDQLAYGNPLPYLKVRMDSGAVRFWVEDFADVPYERVWLYVNGRLAASGGPGTDAAAKCGDEVAAVVKYHSGTKKLEGRIHCTQPIKAPGGGEVRRAIRLTQVTQAYRAMTGDMDQTGPPLRFDGSCDINYDGTGHASVTIVTLRPDVLVCVETSCGPPYTFSWSGRNNPNSGMPVVTSQTLSVHVFKVPDAPASQLLGGGRSVVNIYIYYESYSFSDVSIYNLHVYVNDILVAECYRGINVLRELMSWTEYKEPNATAVYLIRFVGELPKGRKAVLDGNIVLYERKDGSFGYRLIVNPVADPTPADLKVASAHSNLTLRSPSNVVYRGAVSLPFLLEELQIRLHNDDVNVYFGPFFRFLEQLIIDPFQMLMLGQALDEMVDIEFNVPYIAVNKTGEYLVYYTYSSKQSGSATLSFKTLSISSLGAVYANAVLPIDIKLPPPVPPQNSTRTYIFGYR
jgi:hypothetical protein